MTFRITVEHIEVSNTEKLRLLNLQREQLENQIRPLRVIALRQALAKREPGLSARAITVLVDKLDAELEHQHQRNILLDDLLDQIEAHIDTDPTE